MGDELYMCHLNAVEKELRTDDHQMTTLFSRAMLFRIHHMAHNSQYNNILKLDS